MFIRVSSNGGKSALINTARYDYIVEEDGRAVFVRHGSNPFKAGESLDEIEAMLAAARWPGRSEYDT